MTDISSDTKAILLLTAPLMAGRADGTDELLTPSEFRKLSLRLRERDAQPAALLGPDMDGLLHDAADLVDPDRLKRLLDRGFLLSQALERWQARSIWVISREDAAYPQRLTDRLGDDAPAVLYGCGDAALLDQGGLAVVGSRHVDQDLIEYTMAVGEHAARAGRPIISGGARGIDQAAMRGALEAGGAVAGVMADSLERAVMVRENRDVLMEGQLVLVSPYDPKAGFNVGNAMRRNAVVYALADAALVVSAEFNKGGTWAGAVEQLDKRRLVPVYIRATGTLGKGLEALRQKGARPWPDPQDSDAFNALLDSKPDEPPASAVQEELPFGAVNEDAEKYE